MGDLGTRHRALVLVHMLLLQLQSVTVQGADPVSQKLRRLNEQFHQFQALTQARLDLLVLNQSRNSTQGLESRIKALNEHYHRVSQDLEHLKHGTTQEVEGLRKWSTKLDKKNKRMESRLAFMERSLRDDCHQKLKSDYSQDFSNFTLELQSQEEKLGALQVQRDELLIGLKGLQESLKNQALRVARLEGRLSEVLLQWNGRGKVRGSGRAGLPVRSYVSPQEYYEPGRRSQTERGGRPESILDGQPKPEGTGQIQTDVHSPAKQHQHLATNQPKHSKAQRPRHQTEVQYPNPKPHSDKFHPQSQIQTRAQTRAYSMKQPHHIVPHHEAQVQKPSRPHSYHHKQPHVQDHGQPSWTEVLHHPEPNEHLQNWTRLEDPHPRSSHVLSIPKPELYQPLSGQWDEREEDKRDTKIETSVIHNFLQIPVRHKIPAQPIPKKDATICNVDSVLLFPSASAENYVTFSLSLPDLPELSICLWLHVEAAHVGTLLSYATDDNDNQLVLYGRSSSASSTPVSVSSSPSSPFSSLDFVIGDPVYRRLPVSSFLHARWHHICVLWSSIQGRFWHYNDRRLTSSGSNFRKGWEIPGGGSVVLGQEQDSVGGGFDPAEGFVGKMAGFRVWNRVLSPAEVEGVAEGRGVPRGVVLDMEDIKEVHGEVQQVACECLERCV
ncbi:pentraxin-4 [Stegastes partitus]|uniref:Pentraxin-4 n=1 Tax=Stegastes partitus TaxID=144197 RepID=A0A3B5A8M2_9TELE|nr:PREDICTED: pentraxin-4 [Stegastes partitus]